MGYRIVVHMTAVLGAEARLWALVSQRHVDVTAASFEKNRQENQIRATLEVDLDEYRVRRLMRQLERHQDIEHLDLESSESFMGLIGQGRIHHNTRRVRVSAKKGACL